MERDAPGSHPRPLQRLGVAIRRCGGVTFSTHLDTVPPYVSSAPRGNAPLRPRRVGREGNRRGDDGRGGPARRDGEKRVDVLLVVGEEKGSDGARAANNLGRKSRFLINGEPTESKLASGAKGSLRATIRDSRSRSALGVSAPRRSAIEPMLELLPTLRKLPLPSDPVLGETTSISERSKAEPRQTSSPLTPRPRSCSVS